MTWQRGLERISLVWWGFWAFVSASLGVVMMTEPGNRLAGFGVIVLCAAGLYAMHRLSCWVIAGFFAGK